MPEVVRSQAYRNNTTYYGWHTDKEWKGMDPKPHWLVRVLTEEITKEELARLFELRQSKNKNEVKLFFHLRSQYLPFLESKETTLQLKWCFLIVLIFL